MKINNVVIFAAGKGSRLLPLTKNTPKPLVKINGIPMIENTIRILHKEGINNISIVVGYLKEKFSYLVDKYGIKLIENKDFYKYNNISSLYSAKDLFSNTLYVEGDLFVSKEAIVSAIKQVSLSENSIAFGLKTDVDIDEWKFNPVNGFVVNHSPGAKVGDLLWSGILFINEKDGVSLKNSVKEYMEQNPDSYFEVLLWKVSSSVELKELPKKSISEIDTFDDLLKVDSSYKTHANAKLFTPGPTNIPLFIKEALAEGIVHHRSSLAEFYINKNINLAKKIFNNVSGKVIPLTASGTAAMESVVINLTNNNDNLLVLSNGDFGDRFIEIAEANELNLYKYKTSKEFDLKEVERIIENEHINVVAMLHHETSNGILNDIQGVASIANKFGALTIVDSISSIVFEEMKFDEWGISAALMSSPKALQLPPGLSWISLSSKAVEKVKNNKVRSFYFDFKKYLDYLDKYSQTPFTPAISFIMASNVSMENILKVTPKKISERVLEMNSYLVNEMKALGFRIDEEVRRSIAQVVAKVPEGWDSVLLKEKLLENGIYISTGRKENTHKIVRMGLIGPLVMKDCEKLIRIIKEYKSSLNI